MTETSQPQHKKMSSTLVNNGEVLLGKKTNCLLVKDNVGKAKPTTRKLPNEAFTFGKPDPVSEKASSVVNSWQMHQKSKIEKPDPRDFKKLNKMSIREGKFTAPHQSQFRTSHDARIPFGVINEKVISLPGLDHSFGRPNRPQTPVAGIVSNNYGE